MDWIPISCADVRHAGHKVSEGCCSSCHDDEQEGYTNGMCTMGSDYPDFLEPSVCCDVANSVKDVDWLQLTLAHISRNIESGLVSTPSNRTS